MSNNCNHPNCKDGNCEHCIFYKPKFLGIRVPKIVGNWLYRLEMWLLCEGSGKF